MKKFISVVLSTVLVLSSLPLGNRTADAASEDLNISLSSDNPIDVVLAVDNTSVDLTNFNLSIFFSGSGSSSNRFSASAYATDVFRFWASNWFIPTPSY